MNQIVVGFSCFQRIKCCLICVTGIKCAFGIGYISDDVPANCLEILFTLFHLVEIHCLN
jgi:hypothetical protein